MNSCTIVPSVTARVPMYCFFSSGKEAGWARYWYSTLSCRTGWVLGWNQPSGALSMLCLAKVRVNSGNRASKR
jgi:hypothetical protein